VTADKWERRVVALGQRIAAVPYRLNNDGPYVAVPPIGGAGQTGIGGDGVCLACCWPEPQCVCLTEAARELYSQSLSRWKNSYLSPFLKKKQHMDDVVCAWVQQAWPALVRDYPELAEAGMTMSKFGKSKRPYYPGDEDIVDLPWSSLNATGVADQARRGRSVDDWQESVTYRNSPEVREFFGSFRGNGGGWNVGAAKTDNRIEVCRVCGKRLGLREWVQAGCEFSSQMDGCGCNGCVVIAQRNAGQQPEFCSARCRRDVENARARVKDKGTAADRVTRSWAAYGAGSSRTGEAIRKARMAGDTTLTHVAPIARSVTEAVFQPGWDKVSVAVAPSGYRWLAGGVLEYGPPPERDEYIPAEVRLAQNPVTWEQWEQTPVWEQGWDDPEKIALEEFGKIPEHRHNKVERGSESLVLPTFFSDICSPLCQ
jgi:hypothetical protein